MAVIREVTSQDAQQREAGADRATDWVGSYSNAEGMILSGVLSAAAACEHDPKALEAQLHALLELGAGGHTDSRSVAYLREIDLESLPENLVAYVEDLLETT